MLRIILPMLLVIFMVFSGCKRTESPVTRSTSEVQSSAEAQTSDVLIFFSGLMVFHKKDDKYEVGILQTKDGKHKFTVKVDGEGIPEKDWPTGPRWTFVTRPEETTSISAIGEEAIKKRRPDDAAHQNDFGWIIDLEEFHSDLPELEPGHLKPIIQLPYGKLSTKHKSYDLIRWQGGNRETPNKSASKFGFVPETIELALKLRPEQELFLRDDLGNEVKLNLKPTHAPHQVFITNVPNPLSEISDFHHYYELFKDWPKKTEKHYHFKANKDKDRFHPNNPFPGYKYDDPSKLSEYDKLTCCMMACTAVRTTQALQ